jgi:hypothetical protein
MLAVTPFVAFALSLQALPAPPASLALRIVEKDGDGPGAPVPARVHLLGPDGAAVRPPGLPFFRDHFACDGGARLELPAGAYRWEVERGPEYRRASGRVELEGGEETELEVILERRIDLAARGWWSGDLHVHRPLEEMALLLRAEDLHVAPVVTVWNRRNLWKERPLPGRLLFEAEAARVYHALACEDERQGGALLYFNLSRPLELAGDGPEHPSPLVHARKAREQPGAWVDIEKPFWWDVPAWAASGLADSIGLANNHMCRSSMYDGEAWGRPRDAERLPPPRGNGFYSQEIYYKLLNCGFRLPPSAGSASGVLPNPLGYNRVYVRLEGGFSYDAWWRGLAAGRSFVTNGPLLLVEANGSPPGEVFRGREGQPLRIVLDVRCDAEDPLEAVEVVRDGRVVERLEAGELRGWLRPAPLVFERSGWFLVRAIARVPETFRFASTAPYHVELGGRPRRIHRADVEFFIAWIDERLERLRAGKAEKLEGEKLESVLAPHLEARRVFEELLAEAE